jgi:phosphosulfolactate synthase
VILIENLIQALGVKSRPQKPRECGITMMLDKGLGSRQLADLIEMAGDYVDLAKLGWGTSCITNNLTEKITRYRQNGISVYFGGSLFEFFVQQGRFDEYRKLLDEFKIEFVEVSNGIIEMEQDQKLEYIRTLSRDFLVLSEVGSKVPETIISPFKWVQYIKAEIEAGATRIITEGRESGKAGIFRPTGEVRDGLIEEILEEIDPNKLIFETPLKHQQVWFIKRLGPEVNLGNILPEDFISLETLRLGIRADTFHNLFLGNTEK